MSAPSVHRVKGYLKKSKERNIFRARSDETTVSALRVRTELTSRMLSLVLMFFGCFRFFFFFFLFNLFFRPTGPVINISKGASVEQG